MASRTASGRVRVERESSERWDNLSFLLITYFVVNYWSVPGSWFQRQIPLITRQTMWGWREMWKGVCLSHKYSPTLTPPFSWGLNCVCVCVIKNMFSHDLSAHTKNGTCGARVRVKSVSLDSSLSLFRVSMGVYFSLSSFLVKKESFFVRYENQQNGDIDKGVRERGRRGRWEGRIPKKTRAWATLSGSTTYSTGESQKKKKNRDRIR